MTIQRRLVLDALQRARHHVTADDIATRIRARQNPQSDPSTVYRNLEALEEPGTDAHAFRLSRDALAPPDAQRPRPPFLPSCGAEQEVPIGLLEPLARRLRDEHGFRADLAHSAIVGICKACSKYPLRRMRLSLVVVFALAATCAALAGSG